MKYAGAIEFIEQPSGGRRYRPETGWTRVRIWKGATNQVNAFLEQTTIAGFLTVEIEDDPDGYSTVKCDYAYDPASGGQGSTSQPDPLARTWELIPNRIEKSVWEQPWVTKALKEYPANEIAGIRQFIELALEEFKDPNSFTIGVRPGFSDEFKPLYMLLLKKVEAFRDTQYVLRKTETVIPTISGLKAQHSNVGRFFTYAQLVEHEPTLDAAKLIDSANLGPGGLGLIWFKFAPEVRELGRGQWQIVQEYEGDYDYEPSIYQAAK